MVVDVYVCEVLGFAGGLAATAMGSFSSVVPGAGEWKYINILILLVFNY